ncbi:Proline-specific permease [Spathaspora sp. JA1]|nr:Proline-specific permease [Spathaspora sp. JA1]
MSILPDKGGNTLEVVQSPLDQAEFTTKFDDFNDKFDSEQYGETKRKLNGRHVNLMLIGQSIGAGLFIGLAKPLTTSGSLSLFLGFVLYACLMIYPLMQAVGEMCSYLPIRGSFLHFSARWVDPALGFACTLIYLYTALMFVCFEATAVASLVGFWTDINPAIFITITLVTYFLVNVLAVNWYGEIEFFSSMLKVLLIVGLMFFSLISMCGGNPQHNAYGMKNWKEGGLMKSYLVPGETGQFLGFWKVLIYAAFACGGPDLLALCSSEMKSPRKSVGIAAKRSYIRIYLFYFGGIFFLNSLTASNDPNLLLAIETKAVGAAASPWVVGIKNVGVHGLDSLVNACVLTSVWSCGNGFFYGATRCAYSASLAGYLPRFFSKCLPNGSPIFCVIGSVLVGLLAFLNISNSTQTVFDWFINLATTGMLCTYFSIWICYFKFKRAYVKQTGIEFKKGEYKYYMAPKFIHPYFTYLGVTINVLVLFFNGFWIFFPKQFTIADLFTAYFAPVFYICLFGFWKIFKKTHFRSDMEADITTGKEQIDLEEEADIEYEATRERSQNWFYRVGRKISHFLFS